MNLAILVVYTGFVTYLSLRPMGTGSLEPWDKVGHLLIYLCFALLAWRAANTRRIFFLFCLGIFIYSGIMELVQSTMPGRVMSGYDLLANGAGIGLGIALLWRRKK